MTGLRALRLLVLGETWTLPLGVAAVLAAAAFVRHAAPHTWHTAGGFLLLGGVLVVLVGALGRPRASRRPRRSPRPAPRRSG
jgi:hypothetical protein